MRQLRHRLLRQLAHQTEESEHWHLCSDALCLVVMPLKWETFDKKAKIRFLFFLVQDKLLMGCVDSVRI
jgi:hypothetical protein